MTLSTVAEVVRLVVYRHLATQGSLPPRAVLAADAGVEESRFADALHELARTRNIVLRDGDIEMAHPFATRSFGFSVMSSTTLWWGGCAWDSFAIPHLVPGATSVLVATTCPACGAAHAWTVTNAGPPAGEQVAHFLVPASEIWPDAARACENQLIFCNDGCVDQWVTRRGATKGYSMSMQTLWRLASRWYEGRLDSPYNRREPAEAADYFRSVGLRGSFWGLEE